MVYKLARCGVLCLHSRLLELIESKQVSFKGTKETLTVKALTVKDIVSRYN